MFTAAMQIVTGFAPHVTIFLPSDDMATVATHFVQQNKAGYVRKYTQKRHVIPNEVRNPALVLAMSELAAPEYSAPAAYRASCT